MKLIDGQTLKASLNRRECFIGLTATLSIGCLLNFLTAALSGLLIPLATGDIARPSLSSGPSNMPLATLIRRSSLPCPEISTNDAAELLSTHYGLAGSLKELGSHQDRNFLLDGATVGATC